MAEDEMHMEMQQNYLKLQLLSQQIQQAQKQMQQIEEQIIELERVKAALDDVKDSRIGSEMLVPLTAGIFVKAELKNNAELTVNVGSNVAAVKSVEDTKALVDEQMDELVKVNHQLMMDLQNLVMQARKIEKDVSADV